MHDVVAGLTGSEFRGFAAEFLERRARLLERVALREIQSRRAEIGRRFLRRREIISDERLMHLLVVGEKLFVLIRQRRGGERRSESNQRERANCD